MSDKFFEYIGPNITKILSLGAFILLSLKLWFHGFEYKDFKLGKPKRKKKELSKTKHILWAASSNTALILYYLDAEKDEALFAFQGTFVDTQHRDGLTEFERMLAHHIEQAHRIIISFIDTTHVYSKMMSFILKHRSYENIRLVCTTKQYDASIWLLFAAKDSRLKIEVCRVID